MKPRPSAQKTDRDQAAHLLHQWVQEGRIPQESAEWQRCSGFTRELVWTCLRHRGSLDAWIDHLSSRPPGMRIRPLLWIGAAQLLLLGGVPDHAAVHETLETAKHFGISKGQLGFLNALLRKIGREKSALRDWLETQSPEQRFSHPGPLLQRWVSAFGEQTALDLCAWNQQRAHTVARLARTGRENREEQSCDLDPHPEFPDFFVLPRKQSPETLPDFDQGAWYIQDPSTSLAPSLLDVKPGERILDACAAPGGKTLWLAEAMAPDAGGLCAIDPHPGRIRRLKENLNRMAVESVEVQTCEPRDLAVSRREGFDGILLDVPCTNTGVLQRRPDAKWSFTAAKLEELTALQARILEEALPLLKPGGRCVYSTCSIEPEETTEQMSAFLQRHPDWVSEEEILWVPGQRRCDGAYACRLRKPAR